jgi:hypothetical protein
LESGDLGFAARGVPVGRRTEFPQDRFDNDRYHGVFLRNLSTKPVPKVEGLLGRMTVNKRCNRLGGGQLALHVCRSEGL